MKAIITLGLTRLTVQCKVTFVPTLRVVPNDLAMGAAALFPSTPSALFSLSLKMTKPKKPPSPKSRIRKFEIRLSHKEFESLKERFGENQLSRVARNYLLKSELPRRSKIPDQQTLRSLAYIGNNINQIARSLNASKGKATIDKIELLSRLAEVRNLIMEVREVSHDR